MSRLNVFAFSEQIFLYIPFLILTNLEEVDEFLSLIQEVSQLLFLVLPCSHFNLFA